MLRRESSVSGRLQRTAGRCKAAGERNPQSSLSSTLKDGGLTVCVSGAGCAR